MGRGHAGVVGLSFFGGDWAVFGRNGRLRASKGVPRRSLEVQSYAEKKGVSKL